MKGIVRNKIITILATMAWVAVGAAGLVLLVAAVHKKDSKRCKGMEINIIAAGNNFFIDKADVQSIIAAYSGKSVVGNPIENFNLAAMEQTLEKDIWIKNAELFFDNNEILQASVEEREPVARIFTTGGNTFYIDSSLMILPLSEKFSARVPVFTGFPSDVKVLSKPDSNLIADIKTISLYIQRDSFLMAMIDQVDITEQRSFEMIPKIGNQVILFGDGNDIAEKFSKLQLFYKKVMMRYGWGRYSVINLQYKGQVVAKIKGADDKSSDSLRTLQLMQAIATNAAKAASDSIQIVIPENDKNSNDISIIQQSMQREEISEPLSNTVEKPKPQDADLRPIQKTSAPVKKPVGQNAKPMIQPAPKQTIKKRVKQVKEKPKKPTPRNDY